MLNKKNIKSKSYKESFTFKGFKLLFSDLFNSTKNMSFEYYVKNRDSIIFESLFTTH